MNEVDDLLKTENTDDADIEAILDSEFEEEGEPAKERPAETEAQDIVEEEIDEDEIAEILGDSGEPPKKEQAQPQQPKKESVKKKQVPKQPQQQQKEKYHEPDKILLYSEAKVGKTHAIASLIERALSKNPDTHFFAIVTDAGFWKTVKRYWRIRKLDIEKLYSQVSYYPVVDIAEVFDILRQIRAEARQTDWLIIDVLSDFWDRAQDKFIESCSTQDGKFVDLIVEAANDPSRFGTLTGLQWGYCKRIDNTVSYYGVINPPCNIIATASAKELGGIEEALGGEEKVEKSIGSMYSSFKVVGYRPDGQKRLSYKFDDIVFLGKDKSGNHYFVIVGSRDIDTDYKRIPYGFSFWETYIGYKRQKMQL